MLVSVWCHKCHEETVRTVKEGMPTACPGCIQRDSNPTIPGLFDSQPEQMTIEERYGAIDIK